jgi:hypothetical protein
MEDKLLTNAKPDMKKTNPLVFEEGVGNYWTLGEHVGTIGKMEKNYKRKEKP